MVDLTPNVYAHWKLNESTGTLASDSSAHGRDGTTINMEDADWVAGKLNNCLTFDGVNEYVNFGSIAGFERTTPFSVEGWVKLTVNGILIGKNQWISPWRGWYIGTNPSGYLQFVLTNTWGSNQLSAYQDTVNMLDNAWHHFIITYDGSSSVVGVKFYVDGTLRTTKGNPSTLTATIQNVANCQMSGASGVNEVITGLLDETVIYDKVLSQEEVTFRWNSGSGTEDMIDLFTHIASDTLDILDNLSIKSTPDLNAAVSVTDDVLYNLTDECYTVFTLQSDSYTLVLPIPVYGGEEGSVGNDLVLFNFWSEARSVDTIGINSEPIVIGGTIFACGTIPDKDTQMASIGARFLHIHEIMDNHEPVTITGLGNCFDATYIIKDFRYGTIKGSPHAFTWQLTLEYKRPN